MISTRSLDVANVWRVTGGRWNAGAGVAQWARGRVARLHTKQPHLVTLCPPSARRWESIRTRQSHGAARPQLCRVCSVFAVCHRRFQRGTEQRRTGGGGGGMVCAGGHCGLWRGAVIKVVKCGSSGHFVLITGYNGHHHTLAWSAYTRLAPIYAVHFPGYMTHFQTCKQCLSMFESQYCQSLSIFASHLFKQILRPTHKLIPIMAVCNLLRPFVQWRYEI